MNLHQTSLDIIRAGQDADGAYVASPNFSQYGYAWLRDSTWIAYGMDCAGQHDSAHAYYRWVGRTLDGQRERVEQLLHKLEHDEPIDDADYLPTRFALDGTLGEDDWWDFQLDGYGTWLWGLVAHVEQTGDTALWDEVESAVKLTVRYLTPLWQTPNYDCWEEHRHQIHVSTLAALYGGLCAVQRYKPALVPDALPSAIRDFTLQEGTAPDGHLVKYLSNPAVDASLLWAAVPYGLVDVKSPEFSATLAKIERDLHRPDGGVYRYLEDVYYGGGEWLLLTAWLAWVYVKLDRDADARKLMTWINAQATPDGELPEQVIEHMLHPTHRQTWEERWGAIACPLLWSHGMYLVVDSLLEQRA